MAEQGPDKGQVTRLLQRWGEGDQGAFEELLPAIYGELSNLARSHLRRERSGHTLETRALVNEAYLRLVDQQRICWEDRGHFYGIAAHTMRQILIQHARRRGTAKRGGDAWLVSFEEALRVSADAPPEIERLDEALEALSQADPQACQLVELRFFAGLGHREIAELFGVSVATVDRRWRLARAWLFDTLQD